MDGVHDLGGKHGYGPIDRSHENDPYHGDHDARAYGLSVSLRAERTYPIDWFRHTRELTVPTDYLTRPYFDSWLQTSVAMAIEADVLSLAEVTEHKAAGPAPDDAKPLTVDEVKAMLTTPVSFEMEATSAPKLSVGDRVRTASQGHSGHSRLPAYARGAVGVIEAHRGAHPLPDEGARGNHVAEHLYTVAFKARDLFAEVTNDDDVTLDLWESYFVSA